MEFSRFGGNLIHFPTHPPFISPALSVLDFSLLILREQCLREMGLADIFRDIKKTENEGALKALPLLLQSIDAIEDDRDRVLTLVENILAGNMYDWGSTSVMTMLKSGELDFATAKAKVKRPAKFDHSIQLADRLLLSLSHFSGAAYRKVVVFVDNSGADILLGIIPFVRFLVSRCGVQSLILAANSQPSVNDITAEELVGVMERLCEIDPESLGKAWRDGVIKVMASGSDSPCLGNHKLLGLSIKFFLLSLIDLMRIDESLALECRDVDLVIIEGMGRAIHTK